MSDEYEVGTLEDAEKFAIQRMARQAGLDHYLTVRDFPDYLEQFYKLAFAAGAASENEACAKACDDRVASSRDVLAKSTAGLCAAAIRARINK